MADDWLKWPHPGPQARMHEHEHQQQQQQQAYLQQQRQQQAQSTQPQASTASVQPSSDRAPPSIDPTTNVRELVAAEARYRDEMRHADVKLSEAMLTRENQFQTAMREAEIRRTDDLARMKADFDSSQADMLRIQVSNNAKLVSEQLDKVTNMLGERISKLEQFRYESSGKGAGQTNVVGYILAAATIAIAIGMPLMLRAAAPQPQPQPQPTVMVAPAPTAQLVPSR